MAIVRTAVLRIAAVRIAIVWMAAVRMAIVSVAIVSVAIVSVAVVSVAIVSVAIVSVAIVGVAIVRIAAVRMAKVSCVHSKVRALLARLQPRVLYWGLQPHAPRAARRKYLPFEHLGQRVAGLQPRRTGFAGVQPRAELAPRCAPHRLQVAGRSLQPPPAAACSAHVIKR